MVKKRDFTISSKYESLYPEIEDEILDVYAELTIETQDLYLHQLPQLFDLLKIPKTFVNDILRSIDYYYEFMKPVHDLQFDIANIKQYTTINLVKAYTVTVTLNNINNIIDIIDIDKLLKNVNRLVKYRNNYQHIYESWKLFVTAATEQTLEESAVLDFRLSLPDLKKIKLVLNLDHDAKSSFSDSLLIDMLSCSSTDSLGHLLNFDFTKPKVGTCVTFKDFADILGNLGELD
jgi:hypothetical protein